MKNILSFIVRYHFILLFMVLEILAITMLVFSNHYQNTIAIGYGNNIASNIYKSTQNVEEYFYLKKINENLALENAMLRQMKNVSFYQTDTNSFWVSDTLYKQQYLYINARVINNSVNKQKNYITLDKGRNQGVQPDMAVFSPSGVVGIVTHVSDNFSHVMSLLNRNMRFSGKILSSDQMGSVIWDGVSPSKGLLSDIPFHVKLKNGDTIVTSGFSTSYPANLMVGTIENFRVDQGSHFYIISFKYSVDFNALQHVYIVKNLLKEEQEELEKTE